MAQIDEIATVILCDGDEGTLGLLADRLIADHFRTLPASSAVDALRFCRYNEPDILVLSLDLPDLPGRDVIRRIRGADEAEAHFESRLPIIAVTDDACGRAESAELGADDHLHRPFSYDDLKGRITAVLRRRRHDRRAGTTEVGELLIDPARRKVTVGERGVHLARKEFDLLRVLATDPTRVFGKDELLREVWGLKLTADKTRTLDSHASRLRAKLDPKNKKYVVNCWGIGYSLVAP